MPQISKKNLDKFLNRVEDMNELLNLIWMLVDDTKGMSNDEIVEKIRGCLYIYFDKYEDYDKK